jgi:preprotein translocase subunit YajC
MESLALPIILIVVLGLMMWWQSKKAKEQQAQVQDFRESLQPGTEVATIGGIIGKVVSVDTQYEEIVIDSEGSKLRFKFSAVNKTYTRPAYVSDDDADEYGNPLVSADDESDQTQESTAPQDGDTYAQHGEISDDHSLSASGQMPVDTNLAQEDIPQDLVIDDTGSEHTGTGSDRATESEQPNTEQPA